MPPAEFVSKLVERWPNASVRERMFDSPFSHEWEINMPGGILEGKFNQNYSGISIDGDFEDCVAFALWFRSLVPPGQELWFYDDSFINHVDLTPHTSAETVAAAFQ